MPSKATAVSAPGKVLLAGGYLVLDRGYTGLVFGLSARTSVLAGELASGVEGVQLSEVVVSSPQFEGAGWRYGFRLGEGGVQVTELQGFRSHVRAYATHTKEERKFFDITELHLGHTAKSYGLREAPQGVGRGGHDGKKTAMKAAASKKRKQGAGDSARESLFDADTDLAEMERRMKMKMKSVMNSASEFNIG
ncbi:hypothetical protein BN1723_005996, partial [Verticillium longisporum]